MQISQMSDDQLWVATKSWAKREQECSIELLKHLVEVHHRRLWAERGFSSLWEYIRSLGYTENQSYEREGALRFILRNVEAKKAIEEGKINLSQAALTERVLRKEEKETKVQVQPEVVENLISQVQGRSKRDTDRILLAYRPEEVPKERLKQVTETLSQANFAIDEETRRNLEKYWNVRGKTTLSEVFSHCLQFFVEQKIKQKEKKPKEKKVTITRALPAKLKVTPPNSPNIPRRSMSQAVHQKRTRYIPQQVKKQAREAANNQCEYTDEQTGRRCESRYLLQFDHIYPFTFGGTSDVRNIRTLCAVHNRYAWKSLLPSHRWTSNSNSA